MLALSLLVAAPARAADPQGYAVSLTGVTGEIAAVMRESSQLFLLREAGPLPPFALVMRAREDVPRLRTVLDSFGYYQGAVALTVAGLNPEDPDLPARLEDMPAATEAPVAIAITLGPLYRLNRITLEGIEPADHLGALGVAKGDPAAAAPVLDGALRLQGALQDRGHALARVDAPEAWADDEAHTLDLIYKVAAGPQVALGDIRVSGLSRVRENFVRGALTVKPGEPYRPQRIEEARRTLAGLGVFSGVSVRADDSLAPDGRLPLTFEVTERPRRAVAFAGSYSTDLGVTLSASWSHRNLFGNAEQLNLSAAGSGLGNASAGLGYNLRAQYVEPFFRHPDQVLDVSLTAVKQQLDTYDQTAQTLTALVRRKFSTLWSASAGASFAYNFVEQQGASQLYKLFSLPLGGAYDSTGIADAIRDPLTGLRAQLSLTPTYAFGGGDFFYGVTQLSASTYVDLFDDGRSVLAFRGLAGRAFGVSSLSLPPDQRLYVGGSGTVRGYAYQSLGSQFPDGTPAGGTAAAALTAEWRQRIFGDWGGAVFVDAGQGGDEFFDGRLYIGAGAGVRYYTPIGAIRADIAVPLVARPGAGAFQIYIGLGQAF